jgi:hypothetical protein
MKSAQTLFSANKAIDIDQWRIGRNTLPFAHDALRVNDFASQHGAGVHGKLQHVNHFFAAIHFHVGASRHIKSTALRFLRCFVIKQTPKRANGASSFDAGVFYVDGARIGGDDLLPFSLCCKWRQQGQHGKQRLCLIQKVCEFASAILHLQGFLNDSHTPNYKVVHSS